MADSVKPQEKAEKSQSVPKFRHSAFKTQRTEVMSSADLRSAGNLTVQRQLHLLRDRTSSTTPLATTHDGVTTTYLQASEQPLAALVNAHEAVHRAQFDANRLGLPVGSKIELEEEAYRGARILLNDHPFAVRHASVTGEKYALDPQATWYQRATGFSSGMESIENVLNNVLNRVREEQADIYIFSDRFFTRPIVSRILSSACAFRNSANQFIETSPADEPMLPQLRGDLAKLNQAVQLLEANLPATIGTAEMAGRSFVGGVMGAGGAFLGFLRLGLWDSWGQFLFEGSERRVKEAGDGFYQMLVSLDERGLGGTVSQYASDAWTRFTENIENEHITTAGQQFGSTLFDVYFAGRGLVSAGKGLAGMSRAAQLFRQAGNAAPWRAALGLVAREAISFRGVGIHGRGGIWGAKYGLPVVRGAAPRVRIIRYIQSEQDLVAKVMREPAEMLTDQAGQPRAPADIVNQHRMSSSGGSPYQSAYPYADPETMMVANPEGLSGSQNSPYYVVLEVPLDEALVDVNRQVLLSQGLNPGEFPEFELNRYGLQLPNELRPSDLNTLRPQSIFDSPHAHLPPELQAWVRANVAIPENSPAMNALEGIPYSEWEQVALSPDLRPYVVEVRPNPSFTGSRPPINLQSVRPTVYHPTLNPESLSALARNTPQGLRGFTNYFDWLSAQSRLGSTMVPLNTGQIQAGQRLAFLGGIQPEIAPPFIMSFPSPTYGISTQQGVSAQHEVSNRDMLAYLAWINTASGQPIPPELQQFLARPEQQGVPVSSEQMNNAVQTLSTSASRLRQSGDRITSLRSGPGVVSLEVHITSINRIYALVNSVLDEWGRNGRETEAGVVIIIDQTNLQNRDLSHQLSGVNLPSNFHVRIVDSSGVLLCNR